MTRALGRVGVRGSVKDPADAFRAAMLVALGYAPDVIEPGRLQRFATSDKRGDAAGWCKLFIDLRGGVFGCHRQGISETWSAADHVAVTRERLVEQARHAAAATVERARQQRRQWAENAARIMRLWSQCVQLVPGDPVTLRKLPRRSDSLKMETSASSRRIDEEVEIHGGPDPGDPGRRRSRLAGG